MSLEIQITKDDIQLVEKELQLRLDDEERLAILQEIGSCDVQAGPGSGKTTLLTAKLAILARKWPFRDRGVCVLSHTNVARREIEKKLTQSSGLRGLLRYPHFIGTIQTFVDQFLAIPFLRRERVEVTAIDDDRFGSRAWATLIKEGNTAIAALRMYCKGDMARVRAIVASLRLDGARMGVTHSMQNANRFPGPTSTTGKALIAVKQALRHEGYFRYDDMYAFAEACLLKVPYVAPTLRWRFPWVFVDELQDTNSMQDSVIENVFADNGCAFQRFGDKNQAIFDFDADSNDGPGLFGRRKTLLLNTTHRFGKSIANLISPFTAIEPQTLVGNPKLPDLDHTVFIFDRNAVKRVIPLFGDLVFKLVPKEVLQKQPVCVVGGRVNTAQHKKDNFPVFLGEYLDAYVPPKAFKPATPDTFLGYIIEARKKWAEAGTGAEPYNFAISGILALLRRVDTNGTKDVPHTKTALHQALLQSGRFATFQKFLWYLLNPASALSEPVWAKAMKVLPFILSYSNTSNEILEFLAWENCGGIAPSSGTKSANKDENIYYHKVNGTTLPIHLNSIHGVKGETHAATLVVETFAQKQHDLQELLPVLTAQKHGSKLKNRNHCKRAFVAMSRPSHLLCLAISSEHINARQIGALASNGWKVVKVNS